MADIFLNLTLGIIQGLEEYFLYDLDNEEENDSQFTEKVDKVTIEKANKSIEVNRDLKTCQMHH